MIVRRELDARLIEEWEVDPATLQAQGWDGEEDSLNDFDFEVLQHGEMLSDELESTDGYLGYEILSGWDESDRADSGPWVDPDVMAT